MKYAIKYIFVGGYSCYENVNSALERNDHINMADDENDIVVCVYRPIYKSGEYGKRVVVTFNPLKIHHDGDIYDMYV